ncbi:MAG TPA: CsgG/HfaB family protein [Syntrophales bacterium]|nr:CsgG/HfaB family protein [Syntrophales bacterium]HOL58275.1 CsgG/HfaB family protein [Syntrophales bacterium]HPO34444.1 CsgG/HfaB family protein [Syntrophales bacterium]
MKRMLFGGTAILILIAGCATAPQLDLSSYVVDRSPKIQIPAVCKYRYEHAKPLVAVVNFTNNTSFDFAQVVQTQVQGASQRTAVGGAAVGVAPGAAGVVWGTKERASFEANAQTVSRQINAKLSESVEDGVMDEIVNMGGARVFTRKDMDKVFSEQKFQQSGLVDDSTLVKLGKLKGVKYIITGSVNNVDLTYKSFESTKKGLTSGSSSALASILGTVGAAALETQEGWNISTEITLRILDVETGEVVLSKKMSGRHVIGKIPYPNYDAMIGGIKKAAAKALQDSRPDLSKYFLLKGYVIQIKTSPDGTKRAALINIGEKEGLKPGQEFFVYTFEEVEDPMTGKKECDAPKLPVKLVVTDQIQPDRAWTNIEGKPEQIKMVKVGQLVERVPLKGQGFLDKMGM